MWERTEMVEGWGGGLKGGMGVAGEGSVHNGLPLI